MAEDLKFRFDCETKRFVNRVSGEEIPDDEPVIIFRARDIHAVGVLRWYLSQCADPHHQQAVQDKIREFTSYAVATPWAMKEPGITHHVKLTTETRVEAGARALHVEMSRQNVNAYLDGDFDLEALATACLTAKPKED